MLNEIYHAINPIAIQIGPLAIRWYGLAYLTGLLAGSALLYRIARWWRMPLSADEVMQIMIGIGFGLMIFGRLAYVVFYGAGWYLTHPLDIFMLSEGGMSFHGGLFGAVLGGWLMCRMLKLDARTIVDMGVIVAPIGIFFGRIANFINGELWGKPTDLPWAVAFPSGGGVYRHPSQLYEALLEGLLIFIVLYTLSRKRPPHSQGTFVGLFLIMYGVARILVEFVRVPDEQLGYLIGFVTMGQLLSLPLIIIGAYELYRAYIYEIPQRTHIKVN